MADPPATLVVIHLRPEPSAAAVARQLVTATCEASGISPEVCATAALLVSELVTNAVLHAGTKVRLEVHPAGSRVRVNVSDEDAQGPVQVKPRNPTALHGRGLQLVETLASDWGVSRSNATKTVWFELDATAT